VRAGGRLRLYLDGRLAAETACATEAGHSATTAVGIGCNPRYGGNECLPGCVSGVRVYARALSAEDVERDFTGR